MRKYITQAMMRESIDRFLEAARTVDEYKEAIALIDEMDAKVDAAFSKTVWSTDSRQFNWNAYDAEIARKSKKDKDVFELLFVCMCQMHNMIEDKELSALVEQATDKQKEVFFMRYICGFSPQIIAEELKKTDRNVRDMVAQIQSGWYEVLSKRREEKIPLTNRESKFLSTYEWYITPTKDAIPSIYDPIENIGEIVTEALNIGLKFMTTEKEFYDDSRMVAEMCVFAEKYGLLGFMTALPTTPEFMEYDTVYLPKNRHIRKESMPSKEYAKVFSFYRVERKSQSPQSLPQ